MGKWPCASAHGHSALVEAAGSASRVRKSTGQDFSEHSHRFKSRAGRRLMAGCDPGQPRIVPRPPVRDSPGGNSPLNDATTLVHGAHSQRSVLRPVGRRLLKQQRAECCCWQLMPCGQFYEATAPRLAILNVASPVEPDSPPCLYWSSRVPAITHGEVAGMVQSMSSRFLPRIALAISRCTSLLAMSSRLSKLFLPRARPSSTLTRPFLK